MMRESVGGGGGGDDIRVVLMTWMPGIEGECSCIYHVDFVYHIRAVCIIEIVI